MITYDYTGTPSTKPAVRKKEISPTFKDAPKEGLRSRRGKTSIEAAMELKAKRSTLTVSCLLYVCLKGSVKFFLVLSYNIMAYFLKVFSTVVVQT